MARLCLHFCYRYPLSVTLLVAWSLVGVYFLYPFPLEIAILAGLLLGIVSLIFIHKHYILGILLALSSLLCAHIIAHGLQSPPSNFDLETLKNWTSLEGVLLEDAYFLRSGSVSITLGVQKLVFSTTTKSKVSDELVQFPLRFYTKSPVMLLKGQRLTLDFSSWRLQKEIKKIFDEDGQLKNPYYLNIPWSSIEIHSPSKLVLWRSKLLEKTYQSLSQLPILSKHLFLSFALGQRFFLSQYDIETFKQAGTLHLLALSGFHLTLLISLLFLLLQKVHPRWILMLVLTCLLGIYVFLVGSKIPLLRAFLVFLLLSFSEEYFIQHKRSLIEKISLSYLILLLIWPLSVLNLSAQLSFAASFGISLLTPSLTLVLKRIFFFWPILGQGLAISLAAQAGTGFLVLWYFHSFPLLSALNTLLITPVLWLFLTLNLSFLGLTLIPLLNNLLSPLVWGVEILAYNILYILPIPSPGFNIYISAALFYILIVYLLLRTKSIKLHSNNTHH